MKVTKSYIEKLIKEELENVLSEATGKLKGSIRQMDPRFDRYNIILDLDGKRILKTQLPSLIQNIADTPEDVAYRIMKIPTANFGSGFAQDPVTYEMLVDALKSGEIETPLDFSN